MKRHEDEEKEAWGFLDGALNHRRARAVKAPINLEALQSKILRALYRPTGSSYTLRDSEEAHLCNDHKSKDWRNFKYDVSCSGSVNLDFAAFESAIEGRADERDGAGCSRVEMSSAAAAGAFSHPTFEAMGVRKWLLPALGFLGAVGLSERRRTVYRLLLAYVLDPLDPEKPSIFGKSKITGGGGGTTDCPHEECVAKALRAKKEKDKEREAVPDTTEGKCKLCHQRVKGTQKLVGADKKCKLCTLDVDDRPKGGDPRSHMRSSVAIHALAAILRGRGFSLEQRFTAVRVVLGPLSTFQSLRDSDWADLALESLKNNMTRSGISPIQVRFTRALGKCRAQLPFYHGSIFSVQAGTITVGLYYITRHATIGAWEQ